jgi:hypothetical protein
MCSILPQASDVAIDNTDSAWITYRPAEEWKRFVTEKLKTSSQHNTQTGGASFTVKFNGSYVWYVSDRNFDHGRFQVELDGNVSTGSSYDASYQTEEYLFCQELDESREHTLTISNMDDGKYFTVDYITYRPVASSSSSASQPISSPAYSSTAIASDPTLLPAQTTTTGSRGVNPGIYVGIILFIVALVLLAFLVFFVRRDKRRKAQRQQAMAMPPPLETVESGHWTYWPSQGSQSSLTSGHETRRSF